MYSFSSEQITPLFIGAIILLSSILFFNAGKTKASLILLFIGALALGFFMANLDPYIMMWDEQYHALVAKNLSADMLKPTLYSHPILDYDYRNWTSNHIWLHKQPLFLWQMALSMKLFGFNTLALRLPSILLHAFAALMIFRIGKISNSEKTGYYGALLFAAAYYPLELLAGHFSTDHNDLAFLFYITASFWTWFEYQHTQKKYYLILIGLFSGCAVLVKWMVGLLIYAVWFLTLGANDKRNWIKIKSYLPLIISASITLVVFVPWQIYIFLKYPLEAAHEFAYNTQHFFEVIEGHNGDMWFHFNALNDIYGSTIVVLIYAVGLMFFIAKMKSNIYRIATASAIVIVYTFFTIAATKMTSFCIIVSPFVFLGLGCLIDSAVAFISTKIKYKQFEYIFSTLALAIVAPLVMNISKIEHYHTDKYPNDNGFREAELQEIKRIDKLTQHLGDEKYVVFNYTHFRDVQIMFFTNYIAYDFIPTEEQIAQIKSKKYKIAILDDGALPKCIIDKNEIVKIKR